MRLFVAVDVTDEVKGFIYEIQKEFNGSGARINFVAKKNLHITLKFLGNVDEKEIGKIKERLSAIKFRKFALSLSHIGVFPDDGNLRVIWIGFIPEENVIELQKSVDESLIGFGKQETRFASHLTIGRIKSVKDKKSFLNTISNINIKDINFCVDNFTLYRSILTKDGPKYKALESYILE
mgnify:FL=1